MMKGTKYDVQLLRDWFNPPLEAEMFQHVLDEVEKAIESWDNDTLEAANQLDELWWFEWAIDAEFFQMLENWGE